MFEDLEEEGADVHPDSPDRAIAWAIYSRGEAGTVTPDEAWAILHERYPEETRFLLLNAYAELSDSQRQDAGRAATAIGPGYLLKKLERIAGAADDALGGQLRDLMTFCAAVLAGASGDEAGAVALLRARVGIEETDPKRDERDRAGLRLRRFEREVVKELHDRTSEGKSFGKIPVAAPVASPGDEWAAAMADKARPRRKYSATDKLERGELVEHPKFGVGVVTGIEPGKAVILFESGTRKLVAG